MIKIMQSRNLSILAAALAGVLLIGDDVSAQRGERGGDTNEPTRGTREATQDAGGATRGGTDQATREAQRGGETEQKVDPRRGGQVERMPDDGATRGGGQPELDRAQMQKAASMMAQEEKNHRQHMAKIAALRKHFQAKGQTDKLRQVDELQQKELARHDAKMERARQFLGDDRFRKLKDYVGGMNTDRKAALKEKMRENPERAKAKLEEKRKENAGQDAAPQRGGGDADRDGSRAGGGADRDGNRGGGAADRDGGRGGRGGGQDDDGGRGGNDRGGRGGRGGGR